MAILVRLPVEAKQTFSNLGTEKLTLELLSMKFLIESESVME
jgi:hypothetical protein